MEQCVFLPVDEVPPGVGRRGAVGFPHREEKSEKAFAAFAGLVENGHTDHFDLWTYPLLDTHMPADHSPGEKPSWLMGQSYTEVPRPSLRTLAHMECRLAFVDSAVKCDLGLYRGQGDRERREEALSAVPG
ncbi:hypothetical protein PAMP_012478 [Pampus punctatissimus]